MKARQIIIIATLCILLAIPFAALGGNGFKQLRLEADRGTYVGNDTDAWLNDSIVISGNPAFTMGLVYHYSGNGQPETTDGSLLILTTNLNPFTSGIQVTLSNIRYSDFGPTGIPDKTITPDDWIPFGTTDHGLTIFGYTTADHGILKSPNWYTVARLDNISNGKYLKGNESNELLVNITVSATNSSTRLHIDSVGTKPANGIEKGFVGNPYSKDITWQYIPEFATIALPVASVLGIMFIMQRRKKEE